MRDDGLQGRVAAEGRPGSAWLSLSVVLFTLAVASLVWSGTGHAATAPLGSSSVSPASTAASTKSTATPLASGVGYRGELVGRGAQAWYKFDSEGTEWARFELAGPAHGCPYRARMLDAHGHKLGQLVSLSGESLPLTVFFPAHPVSSVYYLRLDADPRSACRRPSYDFRLIEPDQEQPCEQQAGQTVTACAEGTTETASFVPRACSASGKTFERTRAAVERERHRVDRGRGSRATLRRLEAAERAAKRLLHRACR